MKLWVVGSQGMLGTAVLKYCRKNEIPAVGTTRLEADLCSKAQLIAMGQSLCPTHIVNCAAYTDVDGAETSPNVAFAVNSMGVGHLAEVAKTLQCRLVHISTDYVFNGQGSKPYLENSACDPINVYGKSKLEGEKRAQETLSQVCILRTSWLFGSKGKNFISSVLKNFREKEEISVVSDQVGKPTYCEDLVEAIMHLLDYEGIVHFANSEESSRYQIALELFKLYQERANGRSCRILPITSASFPTPAQRPAFSVLDTSKYMSVTSIKPRSWREAAREFLNAEL